MNAIKAEQSSGHSGRIIKAGNITLADPQTANSAARPIAEAKKESRVRLIREGDVVKQIEVRCACGEVIRLDCEY
jgi:hypothetical protein